MNSLLLGDPDPSLRWRVAVELEGAAPDDADVTAWRSLVDASPSIASLVDRLAAARHDPQAAGYLLCRLVYLGYRGPELADAVEGIFEHQQADGSWPVWREDDLAPAPARVTTKGRRRRGQPPAALPPSESYRFITNLTAVPLRGIAAAGFATDPRAERAYDWLVAQRLRDGSWTGSHKADHGLDGRSSGEDPDYRKLNPGDGCRSATTGVVACFALHPERRLSDVARVGVDHLLAQPIRKEATLGWEVSRLVGLERAGGRFTFYVIFDRAFLLDFASRCGVSAEHDRVRALVAELAALRGPFGIWQHPAHPQLSRWLTFDLECSLRRLAGGDWTGDAVDHAPYARARRPRRRY